MGLTVLVVDDSKISRKVSSALLKEVLGARVFCLQAGNGEDALAILGENDIDLMLLDLTMPGMTGYDVLAAMNERKIAVPVLVISADIQPIAKERVIKLGAVGFIKKPLTVDALRTELTRQGVARG